MKKTELDLYTNYLLSTFGAATATGLSAMVEGEVSHDRIRHATFKLECLSIKNKLNPFAFVAKLLVNATQRNATQRNATRTAYAELKLFQAAV